jgi:hypothetical protein
MFAELPEAWRFLDVDPLKGVANPVDPVALVPFLDDQSAF